MAAAIKTTWKGTRHRWCRWHVLRLAKQKIGTPYSKKSTFKNWNILIVPGPVRVAGYVLFSAFFASDERVASESHPPAGVYLTVEMCDIAWRMALPLGATRDHPLANPFGPESPSLEPLPLPPVLLVAPGRDVLYDHVLRYAARLKEMGKAVELAEFAEERHGFSVVAQGSKATEELMRILKQFINHGSAAAALN